MSSSSLGDPLFEAPATSLSPSPSASLAAAGPDRTVIAHRNWQQSAPPTTSSAATSASTVSKASTSASFTTAFSVSAEDDELVPTPLRERSNNASAQVALMRSQSSISQKSNVSNDSHGTAVSKLPRAKERTRAQGIFVKLMIAGFDRYVNDKDRVKPKKGREPSSHHVIVANDSQLRDNGDFEECWDPESDWGVGRNAVSRYAMHSRSIHRKTTHA
jgi:cation transport regulator ChaB